MGRRKTKNNRKPLTNIIGNQETLKVHASEKRNNTKKVSEELETPRPPTAITKNKSGYIPTISSSGKQNDSCKNVQTISRNQKNERALSGSNNITGAEMILYDGLYAEKQKIVYLGTCCVCATEQYSMNCCSQCQQLKYCSAKCRRQHRTNFVQKLLCDRVRSFANARSRLKQEDKDTLMASGIIEISQYLHSVPRPEVYEMLNGPVKAVILKMCEVSLDFLQLYIHVQDISGLTTRLQIQCLFGVLKMGNQNILIDDFLKSLIPGEFILLVDGHWNYVTDPESATIVIDDLEHIKLIY